MFKTISRLQDGKSDKFRNSPARHDASATFLGLRGLLLGFKAGRGIAKFHLRGNCVFNDNGARDHRVN